MGQGGVLSEIPKVSTAQDGARPLAYGAHVLFRTPRDIPICENDPPATRRILNMLIAVREVQVKKGLVKYYTKRCSCGE